MEKNDYNTNALDLNPISTLLNSEQTTDSQSNSMKNSYELISVISTPLSSINNIENIDAISSAPIDTPKQTSDLSIGLQQRVHPHPSLSDPSYAPNTPVFRPSTETPDTPSFSNSNENSNNRIINASSYPLLGLLSNPHVSTVTPPLTSSTIKLPETLVSFTTQTLSQLNPIQSAESTANTPQTSTESPTREEIKEETEIEKEKKENIYVQEVTEQPQYTASIEQQISNTSSTAIVPQSEPSIQKAQTYVDITEFLNLPQSDAAKRLGVPASTLSKRWKEAVPNRKWPYRIVTKIDKEIMTLLHNVPQGPNAPPLTENLEIQLGQLLRKRQDELRSVVIRL